MGEAAEKAAKAAEEKQEQDERKADADEARADAVNRSSDAIERSKNAAERAMHDAYRANADAIKILEYAQYEAAFQERAAQALEFSLQAMKKAEEAEKRAEAAREAIEDFEREAARDGAEDAADAAKRYADQVHLIALSIPKAFGAETSNSDTPKIIPPEGGGCLIATAAYGSEMAPQVQFLRELRDNTVLQTQVGTNFMTGFNQFYYSFSPAVADYERDNPVFKEAVKLSLTPMLTSLALLNYVDVDTEEQMLGWGVSLILLNIGMYFVAPAAAIVAIKRRFF